MATDVSPGHSHIVDVLYMVVPAVLLSFLPGVNGLLGGIMGGFRARTPRNALEAGLAAAVATPATVAALALLSQGSFPSYFFWGLGFWGFALVTALGLLAGALMGAASTPVRPMAHLPAHRRRHALRRHG